VENSGGQGRRAPQKAAVGEDDHGGGGGGHDDNGGRSGTKKWPSAGGGGSLFLYIDPPLVLGLVTNRDKRGCRGSLPPDSKFVSIVCRARMVSTGDNRFYTGLGLRGVIPCLQCRAVVFSC
jgi:hypothetical protein